MALLIYSSIITRLPVRLGGDMVNGIVGTIASLISGDLNISCIRTSERMLGWPFCVSAVS